MSMEQQQIDKGAISRALTAAEVRGDFRFAYLVILLAGLAVVAYVSFFARHAIGDPGDWAAFGDYFGGLLNPVIGIVTVVLVIKTLQATRREADLTRQQLQQQIAHSQLELRLNEMHKRLEGIYGEWGKAVQDKATLPMRTMPGSNQMQLIPELEGASVARVLNDAEFQGESRKVVDGIAGAAYQGYWGKAYGRHANLMAEFGQYCRQYEEAAGNSIVADYYRNRVFMAATTLYQMRLLADSAWDDLRPSALKS